MTTRMRRTRMREWECWLSETREGREVEVVDWE